jgi:hypothetical protein
MYEQTMLSVYVYMHMIIFVSMIRMARPGWSGVLQIGIRAKRDIM